MNSNFFFHSFRALVRVRVFFLIQPPTVLKKNLQKILSSNFSSKCRLIIQHRAKLLLADDDTHTHSLHVSWSYFGMGKDSDCTGDICVNV